MILQTLVTENKSLNLLLKTLLTIIIKEVVLKLRQHGSTTHFKEYKTIKYILKLKQTLDFDFKD